MERCAFMKSVNAQNNWNFELVVESGSSIPICVLLGSSKLIDLGQKNYLMTLSSDRQLWMYSVILVPKNLQIVVYIVVISKIFSLKLMEKLYLVLGI